MQHPISTQNRSTILIVDDMPENLALLGEIVEERYRVQIALNGRRALEIAHRDPKPDLILLDIMMPGMDGYQVLEQLHQSPTTRNIPVIFITAMESNEDEQRGLELGAVDYITKPIKPAIVLARIATHIELKRTRDELEHYNHYLEAEVEKRIAENQLIQDISIRALAGLAETRDNETGNHIIRTQFYINVLARHLQSRTDYQYSLSDEAVELITKAAPLHDIGKVGIPDHILLKPGPLTDEEWQVMKTHSRLGSDAIGMALRDVRNHAPLAHFHVAMDIAHYHHERWDGKGYPEGLAKEHIPLAARLMAVADVFDALITKRVYKEAMPYDKAAKIIRQGRGTQFDPLLVDAFEQCYSEFKTIADRFKD
ncbi:two-component system response regulator [Ectothiorhodospiraceae bacterium BW-2]|nr:two-component system response regulator [Ectothiorhodospiraceae bacterium BW-2]